VTEIHLSFNLEDGGLYLRLFPDVLLMAYRRAVDAGHGSARAAAQHPSLPHSAQGLVGPALCFPARDRSPSLSFALFISCWALLSPVVSKGRAEAHPACQGHRSCGQRRGDASSVQGELRSFLKRRGEVGWEWT